MNVLALLLAATTTLVLTSGDRIVTDEPVREENGVIVFRAGGLLYSVPAIEVDRIESTSEDEEEATTDATRPAEENANERGDDHKHFRVSEEDRKRLLAELESNHSGTPAEPLPIPEVRSPSRSETEQKNAEEWRWRNEARAHEEAVRQAEEELQLIEQRIEQLESQIRTFLTLGYDPRQFTYQTSELVRAREQIPYARLEVERAKRALDQFREDARRQGILPGWLR
jgi:hypothetical protein